LKALDFTLKPFHVGDIGYLSLQARVLVHVDKIVSEGSPALELVLNLVREVSVALLFELKFF
jgi:hypothetical protein